MWMSPGLVEQMARVRIEELLRRSEEAQRLRIR